MSDVANEILGPVEAEGDPYETIAGEFASSLEAKDSKQMAKALKAFVAMVQAEPEDQVEAE